MNKIFIEAKKPQTSEYCFLETILKNEFPMQNVYFPTQMIFMLHKVLYINM